MAVMNRLVMTVAIFVILAAFAQSSPAEPPKFNAPGSQ
jgi:hypothetical protein